MTEEQVKTDTTSLIESVIEKVKNVDFNIYIYCPAMAAPSGGIGVLFKHARILKAAGYKPVIIYEPREDAKASYNESMKHKKKIAVYEPFNPTWAGDLSDLKFQCLGEGDIKFNNGKTEKCAPLTLNPEDFMIIPEGFPNIMERTAQIGCKRIVMAQSWYYILNALSIGQTWRNFGINDVISVSDGISQYINTIMPGMNIKQFSQSIDRNLFKPVSMIDKVPLNTGGLDSTN
jgi:hypothetical protein